MTSDLIEPVHLFVGRTALPGVEKVFLPLPYRNTDGCTPASFPVNSFANVVPPADAGGVPTRSKSMRWRSMLRRRAQDHRKSPTTDHTRSIQLSASRNTSAPLTGVPACFARPPSIPSRQIGPSAGARNPAQEVGRPGYADRPRKARAQLLASTDNSATTALLHAGEACLQQA